VVIVWADIDAALRIIKAAQVEHMNDTLWVIGTETMDAGRRLTAVNDINVIKLTISDISVHELVNHLNGIGYQSKLNNVWIRDFWMAFGLCPEFEPKPPGCFNMAPSGFILPKNRHENVIASVYTLAYGLHDFLQCNASSCNTSLIREPFDYERFRTLLTRSGNKFRVPGSDMVIEFNKEGDVTVNAYNFQLIAGKQGSIQIGHWFGKSRLISIDEEIWSKYNITRPNATCAFPCQPGTYRYSGSSVCCWECILCPNDEISSKENARSCKRCREIEVPNAKHDSCVKLTDTRLSIESSTGQTVMALSLMGFLAATFVLCVFIRYWETPVVKSSSREMTVIQLVSMMLLFCYPILHVTQANIVTCIMRKILFGSLHTLILAFLLIKTYRLFHIFQPRQFLKISKFYQNKFQVMTSFLFVALLLLVLTAWYYNNLPRVSLHVSKEEMAYVYYCGENEDILLYSIVGYIILLSLASGFMAFRTRRLPSNFKEAEYIWLAMFTCCLAWIIMFPLYSTQQQHVKPLVVIGVNGASTLIMLLVLYGYKIRIILFKPHFNSHEHFSKLAANATVSTFLKDVDPQARRSIVPSASQRQSVISFDFDGMFDEYQKQKTRKETLKESFRHFPRTLRLSRRSSKPSSKTPGSTIKRRDKKQQSKILKIKKKNRTLQHPKKKPGMPPKSLSFDESRVFAHAGGKEISHKEFFIDIEDGTRFTNSRSASNVSLINVKNNASNTNNQSKSGSNLISQLKDIKKRMHSQSNDNTTTADQSKDEHNKTNQSEDNSQVNGYTNGLVDGTNLESFDTFV